MTTYEVNVTGLALSENSDLDFDNEIDLSLIKTFIPTINPHFNIEFTLKAIYDSYSEFSYIFNASFNMSSDIYIEATKEADYLIDDGGFWVFGKI